MRHIIIGLLVTASVCSWNVQTQAQPSQATGTPVVVVTPLKTERPIDKVPMAVSRISGGALDRAIVQSIDDITKEIPNVDSAGGPRITSEEPSIRGLSDRRIVIKVDGIRRNFRAQYGGRYFIDPWLIESAEVVRGANSAIDGSGSIGGVMQLFTDNARDALKGTGKDWGVKTRAGYQSVDDQKSEMVEGYAAKGPIDVLVAQTYRDATSIETGAGTTLRPGDTTPHNILAKLGYEMNPKHRIELRYAEYEEDADLPVSPFQPLSSTNTAAERTSKVQDISVKYRLAPEEETLRNIFDVTTILYHSQYDIDQTRLSDNRLDQTDFTTTGFDLYNTSSLVISDFASKLTVGTEYYENEQAGTRNGGFRPLLGDGKDENIGVYGQLEIDLPYDITLTPGVRYDHYTLKPGQAGLDKKTDSEISPKIAANWQIDPNWSVYGSVATAFRTPTLTELYASGTIFPGNTLISNPNLAAETAFSRELGFRYRKPDLFVSGDAVKFSMTVFDSDIDDYIEQVIGSTTTEFRNVTTARLTGMETEASYSLADWTGRFSYGTVNGKNKTSGVPLSDVTPPRFTFGLEKQWFDREFLTGARFTHYAAQNQIPPNQPLITASQPANTMDVYAAWTPYSPELQGLEVRMGVDNLFDANYRRYLAFTPEAGRNIKLDVSWKF